MLSAPGIHCMTLKPVNPGVKEPSLVYSHATTDCTASRKVSRTPLTFPGNKQTFYKPQIAGTGGPAAAPPPSSHVNTATRVQRPFVRQHVRMHTEKGGGSGMSGAEKTVLPWPPNHHLARTTMMRCPISWHLF